MTFIKKVAFLLLAFVCLDFGVAAVLQALSNESQIRYSRLYQGGNDADLVILGNSRAVNSFYAPYLQAIYGFGVFNLAYNGMSMPVTNIILEDYLSRNKAPKNVAIEVTALESGYDVLPNLRQYMSESDLISQHLKESFKDIYVSSWLSRSYRYNSEYFLRTLYYLGKSDQDWINRYSISNELYNQLTESKRSLTLFNKIDDASLEALNGIINRCKQANIRVYLLLAPVLDVVRDEGEVNAYIKRIEVSTGLKVYDMSAAIKDPGYFADSIHTNDGGAKVIADMLRKQGWFLGEEQP